jgi:hypothetical protein
MMRWAVLECDRILEALRGRQSGSAKRLRKQERMREMAGAAP